MVDTGMSKRNSGAGANLSGEEPARLTPVYATMRELHLKSGNICAHPDCERLMMNAKGVFVGNVCHIEAAEKGGPRFNPAMTNEERRHFSNLMLMCYDHHVESNDEDEYPVERLREIKADHERRFTDPARTILGTLKDWTAATDPTFPLNLERLFRDSSAKLTPAERATSVHEMTKYIGRFRYIPVEVRQFLGAVAERAHKMKHLGAVDRHGSEGTLVNAADLRLAFRLSLDGFEERVGWLETYRLGGFDYMSAGLDDVAAVCIRDIDGWPIWMDLAEVCARDGIPMETFSVDMDFARLDSE